jgi:hypothetical protein
MGKVRATASGCWRTRCSQRGSEGPAVKKMVTPAALREAVAHLQTALGMSERRACAVVGADRKSMRYRSCRGDDGDLRSGDTGTTCATLGRVPRRCCFCRRACWASNRSGYARAAVRPQPSGLLWASGTVPTAHGPITVEWHGARVRSICRTGGRLRSRDARYMAGGTALPLARVCNVGAANHRQSCLTFIAAFGSAMSDRFTCLAFAVRWRMPPPPGSVAAST